MTKKAFLDEYNQRLKKKQQALQALTGEVRETQDLLLEHEAVVNASLATALLKEEKLVYSPDQPPDQIKGLPKHAQEIWIAAFNSAYEQYEDEGKAAATAWAAVKTKYKQDKDGTWVALEEKMETVNIANVEIAAVGKWHGMANGKPVEIEITAKDLDALVDSFDELSGNEKLNYEPPVKLGHDDKQKLLQEDGYPAAGWIDSVKKVGNKLVSAWRDVPKKIAELIKAGAYRKISPEFYSDYAIGGKTYSRVLKAVSLLGADIPAIKSTKDIAALYGSEAMLDEQGVPFQTLLFEDSGEVTLDEIMSDLDAWLEKAEGKIHGKAGSPVIRTYLKEVKSKLKALMAKDSKLSESLSKKMDSIYSAWRAQMPPQSIVAESNIGWVTETFDDYVIIEKLGKFFKVPYSDKDGNITFEMDKAEEVKRETKYIKASENTEEVIMEKEIRALLELDEKADILATVKALKEKAEAKAEVVSLVEHQATESKVKVLETKLAERERDERVSKAISAGKLTPAQSKLPVMLTLAEKDPSGFQAFVDAQPVVVKFGELGAEGGNPDEVTLTEAEISLGEKLGVSKEALIKAKK